MLVELIALGAVAGEHVLVLGPPGTAKSQAVRHVARGFSGNYFEYLLGRFTEPSELFGTVNLRKLRDGVVETETTNMLPEAEIAFLDEVFLGSTAILNTLLALLNERTFRRGHTDIRVPLRVCVGAANSLPVDESLAAFADRFLLRLFVEPVPDAQLEDLLEAGWSLETRAEPRTASIEQIDALAEVARAADLTAVRPHLAHAFRVLRSAGVELSDRRMVKVQRLIAAAAALDARSTPTVADLWPIIYAVPTAEGQQQARDALRETLDASDNAALREAAAEASLGPLARAARLIATGSRLLEAERDDDWSLKLEGVLREIDAGFAPADRPDNLQQLRARIVEAVGSTD